MGPLTLVAATWAATLCPAAVGAGWQKHGDASFTPESLTLDYRGDLAAQRQVARIFAALRARGTQVVVMLVPSRTSVLLVGEEVALAKGRWRWVDEQARYRGTLQWLRDQGVLAPDLLSLALESEARGMPYSRRGDGHWTMDGARVSAEAAASMIRGVKAWPWLGSAPQAMVRSMNPRVPRTGDLEVLVGKACGTPPEPEAPVHTWAVKTPQALGTGLLDDVPPPAVVSIGSSFSGPAFQLAEHLRDLLDAPVLDVYVDGGRFSSALREYLISPEWAARPPDVLVWTIAIEHLYGWAPPYEANLREAAGVRGLLPMIDGGCTPADADRALTVRADGTLLGDGDAPVPSEGRYLQVESPTLATRKWTLRVRHADGTEDPAIVEPDPRAPSGPRMFVELNQDVRAPVTALRVEPPTGVPLADVSARICRYPG